METDRDGNSAHAPGMKKMSLKEARQLVAALLEEGLTLVELRQALSDARLVESDQRMRVPPPPRLKLPGVGTHARTWPTGWRVVCNAAPIPSARAAPARHLRLVWSA